MIVYVILIIVFGLFVLLKARKGNAFIDHMMPDSLTWKVEFERERQEEQERLSREILEHWNNSNEETNQKSGSDRD